MRGGQEVLSLTYLNEREIDEHSFIFKHNHRLCQCTIYSDLRVFALPSVLWHCWLGVRMSIQPVKDWMMGHWRGYLSGVWCKWFAYGTADATFTPSSLASVKSRMVYLSGAGLCRLSWKKAIKCKLCLEFLHACETEKMWLLHHMVSGQENMVDDSFIQIQIQVKHLAKHVTYEQIHCHAKNKGTWTIWRFSLIATAVCEVS